MARFWFNQRRKAVEPFLFVSYGMTKCGSTLAFQLARVALIQAGFEQPVVTRGSGDRKINFVPILTEERADHFRKQIDALGHPLVIKTHSPAEAPALKMLSRGEARAHAAYRDLRDMALSMLDHGVRAREKGRPAFAEIETMADARAGIDNQVEKLMTWASQPGVELMGYDQLAFATAEAAERVLGQLGIDGAPKKIARQVLKREFTQRNKAQKDRWRTEMSAKDSAAFRSAYAPFYEHLIDQPARSLPPGLTLKAETAGARP